MTEKESKSKGNLSNHQKMSKILVTNIQRFCLHDGPGIRTTVFLKGCSLRCPWCSNPENFESYPEPYIMNGISGVYGCYYKPHELINECLKDKNFYDGKIDKAHWNISDPSEINNLPGGVTFSGGECLLQMEALAPVCDELHYQSIHIAAETCLFVPQSNIALALDHIDLFYVDMKILNIERCKSIEHGNLNLFYDNLDMLMKSGKPVVIRIPVIGAYTDDEKNRTAVKQLLEKYKARVLKIELIKEHNLGESKYKSLGKEMDYHGVEDSLMEQYKAELADLTILTEVCI